MGPFYCKAFDNVPLRYTVEPTGSCQDNYGSYSVTLHRAFTDYSYTIMRIKQYKPA